MARVSKGTKLMAMTAIFAAAGVVFLAISLSRSQGDSEQLAAAAVGILFIILSVKMFSKTRSRG